ncbi:MAG: YpdA family putative bacillithiol disulfide reductase [Bacteroidetes bacterium]|nr:MAG: YpdA family putative bacillithiol disulfide reductase [Bacteroidota bacterium]
MKDVLDVLIVGGGPIGLACGIEATKREVDYLIVEKGCLVNSIYNYPANMTFFSTSVKIEMGDVPFISHNPRPTRREALEYYRRVKQHWGLRVNLYEKVERLERQQNFFTIYTSQAQYHARAVVVATGFYDHPNLLHIPGEELPKVRHYYDDPHPYIDAKVIVVGAANSAVDAALEVWAKGAEVTLVHRGEEISHRVKYWIRPNFENRVKEGSIKTLFRSQLVAIRPKEVDIRTPEGLITLENDFVLAMTGYHPDYSWLENMGIQCSEDHLRLPSRDEFTFETNVPNMFLAGTVCGGMNTNKWFIENSIEHAGIIMEEIARRLRRETISG